MKLCQHVFCRVCTWILRLYQEEPGAPTALACPLCRQNPSQIETNGPSEVLSIKPLSSYLQNTGSSGCDRWGWLFSQPTMWSGTWSTGYHERAAAASLLASQQVPRYERTKDKANRERVLEPLSVGTEFRPTPGKARWSEKAVDGPNPFVQVAISNSSLGDGQGATFRRPAPSFGWSLWSFLEEGRLHNLF